MSFEKNDFFPPILAHNYATFKPNLYLCWSVPLRKCKVCFEKISNKVSRVFQQWLMKFCFAILFCMDLIAASRRRACLFSKKQLCSSHLISCSLLLKFFKGTKLFSWLRDAGNGRSNHIFIFSFLSTGPCPGMPLIVAGMENRS